MVAKWFASMPKVVSEANRSKTRVSIPTMESPTRSGARETSPGLEVEVEGERRHLPPVDVEFPPNTDVSLAGKKVAAQRKIQRLLRESVA